jgi:integrase
MPAEQFFFKDAAVRAALAAPGKSIPRVLVDKEVRGFYIIVNAQSARYVLQRKLHGKTIKMDIGRVNDISAADARARALGYVKQFTEGVNPREVERASRVKGMTLAEAYKLFMGSEPRSDKTVLEYDGWFERHLKRWEHRTMEEIGNDRPGVRKLHDTITANARAALVKQKAKLEDEAKREVPATAGYAMANNCLRLLRSIYNRARVEVPSLPEDPTVNVNWHKDRVRNTSLTVEDLATWFARVEALTNPVKRDYWLSIILTGGRRSQIAESKWEHIDFTKGTWHFPKPKGGTDRAYTIPVSRHLLDRLKAAQDRNAKEYAGSPWVFPSAKSTSKHLSIPRNDKQGLPMAHALRHTYRTHSLIAGVSDIESHLLMNHKPDGVNYDYISRAVTIEHLRVAQEKITAHFLRCFEGDAGKQQKVVAIR